MTVKELKETLNKFDDNLLVVTICCNCGHYMHVTHTAQGCNEADGCLFLDDYEEEDDIQPETKQGYCPLCDKDIFIETERSMGYCPHCGHDICLHAYSGDE